MIIGLVEKWGRWRKRKNVVNYTNMSSNMIQKPKMQIVYNGLNVFLLCMVMKHGKQRLTTIYIHQPQTSHVETFVITMLKCSKSNRWLILNIENRFNHLNIQHEKNRCQHTQIMIATSREKYILCRSWIPLAPKKNATLAHKQP